jgi:hypothetical protein
MAAAWIAGAAAAAAAASFTFAVLYSTMQHFLGLQKEFQQLATALSTWQGTQESGTGCMLYTPLLCAQCAG